MSHLSRVTFVLNLTKAKNNAVPKLSSKLISLIVMYIMQIRTNQVNRSEAQQRKYFPTLFQLFPFPSVDLTSLWYIGNRIACWRMSRNGLNRPVSAATDKSNTWSRSQLISDRFRLLWKLKANSSCLHLANTPNSVNLHEDNDHHTTLCETWVDYSHNYP